MTIGAAGDPVNLVSIWICGRVRRRPSWAPRSWAAVTKRLAPAVVKSGVMTERERRQASPVSLQPDPVTEAYKRDVDRSLFRENLKKTPTERVLALMKLQRLAEEARAAGKRLRDD